MVCPYPPGYDLCICGDHKEYGRDNTNADIHQAIEETPPLTPECYLQANTYYYSVYLLGSESGFRPSERSQVCNATLISYLSMRKRFCKA